MRKKTIAVVLATLMLLSVAACESRTELPPSSPGSEAAPAPAVMPQARLAAKEAGEMAYEHASAQYDEKLYLCEVKAGGTVMVTHQKGHGAVEGGCEDTWSVVLHRHDSESTYTQILVGIRENEVASCNEAGTFGVYGGSWERHTETKIFDISQLNTLVDSPRAVEIAQECGAEGLGPMFVRLGRTIAYENKLVYIVILGPVSGEGGAGLKVNIDATDGTVLGTEETTWK
jgi:hypothetical protein